MDMIGLDEQTTSSRSSLRRGAWIETSTRSRSTTRVLVAPLFGGERGLKQTNISAASEGEGRSSLRRGAWIETWRFRRLHRVQAVAPLFGGERGLKRGLFGIGFYREFVAPLFGGERGLKRYGGAA